MVKRALFFALVCVIGIVLWIETRRVLKIEGFKSAATDPAVNVPKVLPDPAQLYPGTPQPFAPPTTALLAPPPGQLASVNAYEYEDPAMKRAKRGRIQGIYEALQGFLINEAPGLSQMGDPSVVLPLGTARADLQRIEDELSVLKRNPGLQSSLTDKDINDIQSNLAYLQRKWRLSANSIVPAGAIEGFDNYPDARLAAAMRDKRAEGFQTAAGGTAMDPLSQLTTAPDGATSGAVSTGTKATLQDLQTLVTKITDAITELSASNSEDVLTQTRIQNLKSVQGSVQTSIDQIKAGQMTEAQITLTKEEINSFLPLMTTTMSQDLPALSVAGTGTSGGATAGATDLQNFLSSGGFKNTSFDATFNVRYTSEEDRKLAEDVINAAKTIGSASAFSASYGPGSAPAAAPAGPRGQFEGIIQMLTKSLGMGSPLSGSGTPSAEATPSTEATTAAQPNIGAGNAPSDPAKFDWKTRLGFICDQIQKRGWEPAEYACLADINAVGENFSYRGRTKAVCSRLSTHYEPGTPEMLGCPPPGWAGWRQ